MYLPIPIDQLPDLLGNERPGFGIFNLLLQKTPKPPNPLLRRPELTNYLKKLVMHRRSILLTGTVYKGKTTAAQLVASDLCPQAWWINLSGRKPEQIDNVLLVLADRIDESDCPNIIIIDDINISPTFYHVYKDSLLLVLHRANTNGYCLILTAQGDTSNLADVQGIKHFDVVEVPELKKEEIKVLCIEQGCPQDVAVLWSTIITAKTNGHPKLVQIQIIELAAKEWQTPTADDIVKKSTALSSAQKIARQLLCDSQPPNIVELLYMFSECSTLIHRSVAIHLVETADGSISGGDVLDSLTGKWIERIEDGWYRTTELLKGVTSDVWSTNKKKRAHIRLHDAIRTKSTLQPFEASALLFHAYMGEDPHRIGNTALKLQMISDKDALNEVERNLLWLPYVALLDGQTITDHTPTNVILRRLQFQVALSLDSENIPDICDRWAEDIARLTHPEQKPLGQWTLWLSTGFNRNIKIPLRFRLDAINGIPSLPAEFFNEASDLSRKFYEPWLQSYGLPKEGTITQTIFLYAIQTIRGLKSLEKLLDWIENVASENAIQQFDEMIEWPIVQESGAFILGAWAPVHEQIKDWEPWLLLLEHINECAKQKKMPRFGREAAKLKAILLSEHLDRIKDALTILDQAERTFGQSIVLKDQRANVLFQSQDDEAVLKIWDQLADDPESRDALDPFAYRRAGISASRLKKWDQAEEIFSAAADSIQPGFLEHTKFGLRLDAVSVVSLSGDQYRAIKLLADAVLSLPKEAMEEGNEQWEALQRVAINICINIENIVWKRKGEVRKLEPGYASTPKLTFSSSTPGQALRSEMLRVRVLHILMTIAKKPLGYVQELEPLNDSNYPFVRWMACEAKLSLSFNTGAGSGFIEAFIDFIKSNVEFVEKIPELTTDYSLKKVPQSNLFDSPQHWFGLIYAGAICAGDKVHSLLEIWHKSSERRFGKENALTEEIRLLLEGVSSPAKMLKTTIKDTNNPKAVRIGAAIQLLLEDLSAEETLQMQLFVTSGLMSDASYARQVIFNRHVACCFARPWRKHVKNSFQFNLPQISVPKIVEALDDVEYQCGTLKTVFIEVAKALNVAFGQFMEHVL